MSGGRGKGGGKGYGSGGKGLGKGGAASATRRSSATTFKALPSRLSAAWLAAVVSSVSLA
eukprot:EC849926.1.p2 GENE.EC849926.1~~EC849926.1.p2  ORF type:complete len:60 (+),score=3.01 EC849926.1:52-231(+)